MVWHWVWLGSWEELELEVAERWWDHDRGTALWGWPGVLSPPRRRLGGTDGGRGPGRGPPAPVGCQPLGAATLRDNIERERNICEKEEESECKLKKNREERTAYSAAMGRR